MNKNVTTIKGIEGQALDDIAIIRKRPGMFIGDVETPDHLVEEILDNSLDEISNKYATIIKLYNNDKDGSFWCSDNGRGIPLGKTQLPDGTENDTVIVFCTKLFSGTKFDNTDYEQLIGMHGVGLVAVNALSEWMTITTRDRIDRKKIVTYTFKNSIFETKTESINEDYSFSTIIGFKPNPNYFSSIKFNDRRFIERLVLVQSFCGLESFTYNNKQIPKIDFDGFVKQYLKIPKNIQLYSIDYSKNNFKIGIYAIYTEDDETTIAGSTNLRICDGKFINSFQTVLKKIISEKIDKRFNKISERDLLNGLKCFICLSVPEPKFDSQTKVRMTLDVKKILIDPLKPKLEWFVNQVIQIIEKNLERKLFKEISISSKSTSKSTKRVSADNKLRDCRIIPGNILYIVEGDSADGPLKEIRDKDYEASFPLKGKVLNVETTSLEKLKNNKEVKDLLEALGPISNRRYKTVKILTDADSDGYHICVLLILIFQKFAPDYIKEQRLRVIIPPLYGAQKKGSKFIPIFDISKIEEYRQQKYDIIRFKGIGEMDSELHLKPCLDSGFEYVVQWPESPEMSAHLLSVIVNKDVKRALLNETKVNMNVILTEAKKNLKQIN